MEEVAMRGTIAAAACAVAALVAGTSGAGQAQAESGMVVSHPDSPPFDYPPGEVCGFGTHVEFPVSDLTMSVWHDAGGRPVFGTETGALVMRATNTSTGATIERDISGSGSLLYPTLDPADFVLSGNDWSAGIHGGDQPDSAQHHWYLSHGFMSVRVTSANGHTTRQLLALVGPYEDLCVTLSG
ncbi:hypothetical protein VMT65_31265 [Nocardia sp. CDC153]|uniref:hypothetical protein n=1 Tax=Nocardia sp. CDC153 TaxID=3112167 RepID=UPI002DBA0B72|nr:hypothetical protein [Nocardia sp. CDC153]MEC3957549.1 hypothetical protein [Nocardia sp. CDC153]